MVDSEIEHLKTLSKSLNDNLGLTQLSLMNFCEAYHKHLLRLSQHPKATDDFAKAASVIIESNNKLQAQFLDVKSGITSMLGTAFIS